MLIIDLRNKRILSKYSYSVVGNKDSDVILFYSHFVQYANHNIYLKVLNDYYADKIDIPADKVRVEDGVLVVEWTMNEASCYGDKLMLQLQFEKDGEIAQSSIAIVTLANTLNVSETIEQQYPRVLEHLQEEIDALGDIDALVEVSYENGIFTFTSKDGTETEVDLSEDFASKDYVDTGLSNKVDKEQGKGLSTNDYTNADKNKLAIAPATYTVDDYQNIPNEILSVVKKGDIIIASGYVFSVIEHAEQSVETRCMFYDGLTECQTVKECQYYGGHFESENNYPFGDVKSVNYAYPDEYGNVRLNIEPKYDGDLTFESITFVGVSGQEYLKKYFPSSLTKKLLRIDGNETGGFLSNLSIRFKSNQLPEKLLNEIENNRLVIRFDYPVGIRNNNGGAGRRSFCHEQNHYSEDNHKRLIYRVKYSDVKTNRFGEKYIEVIRPLYDFMTDMIIPTDGGARFYCLNYYNSYALNALCDEVGETSPTKDFNRPAWCKGRKSSAFGGLSKVKTFGSNLDNPISGYHHFSSEPAPNGNYPTGYNYYGDNLSKTLLERYYQEVCFGLDIHNSIENDYFEVNHLPLRLKDYCFYGDREGEATVFEHDWYYFLQNRQRENGAYVPKGRLKKKNKFVLRPRFAVLMEEDIEDISGAMWKKTYPQSQQQIQIYMPSINLTSYDYEREEYDNYFVIAQVSITPL